MSEQNPEAQAIESPEFFQPPKRPKGIIRINWRLLWLIVGGLVILFGIPVIYTYWGHFNPSHAAGNVEEEEVKIPDVMVSPIKPREEIPVRPMPIPVVDATGAPVVPGLSEEEKRIRDKKRAALEAAMVAKSEVYKREDTANVQNPMGQMEGRQNAGVMPGVNGVMPLPPLAPADNEYGDESDVNKQAEKLAFLQAREQEMSPYLKHTRMAPLSALEVKAGTIIPGTLITGVNSDLPGQIIGQVRENVYDSATRRYVLIPAGAKLIGTYDSQVAAGQERVLIAWNRVIFSDGSSLTLGTMPGADQAGYAGMKDQVDNHYVRVFGQAALLSLFSAAVQLSQPRGAVQGTYNSQQIMAAAIGQQLFALGSRIMGRGLNIQPTLEIRPGFKFSVMVNKDIVLPPWQGHPLAQARDEQ